MEWGWKFWNSISSCTSGGSSECLLLCWTLMVPEVNPITNTLLKVWERKPSSNIRRWTSRQLKCPSKETWSSNQLKFQWNNLLRKNQSHQTLKIYLQVVQNLYFLLIMNVTKCPPIGHHGKWEVKVAGFPLSRWRQSFINWKITMEERFIEDSNPSMVSLK